MARAVVSTGRTKPPLFLGLERALAGRLARRADKRSREHARRLAIARFAHAYPLWHASLFDPALLASLPDDFFSRNARSVARSWTMQFPYRNEQSRERDVRILEPVADGFLRLLAEEEARLEIQMAAGGRPGGYVA
ncbi:MAG: hypothetical protein WD314_13295 [Trueperaceae bacterium]